MNGNGGMAAERLVKFLRRFRLPRALREKYPLARKSLMPFYYSRDSLDVISLYDEMPQILAASEYLIVVCTSDYAVPGNSARCYADVAVASFLGWQVSSSEPHGVPVEEIDACVASTDPERVKKIIPVFFPDARKNETTEDCIPLLLRKLNCVGPSTELYSETRVFNAVAARMLGIPFEEVYSRWTQQQRRHKRLLTAAGTVLGAAAAYAAWWSWDYYVPHEHFYADYVEKDAVPVGIRELTEAEAKQRFFHYRFITEKHHVRSVRCENAYGKLFTNPVAGMVDRPAEVVLEYKEDGKVGTRQHTYEEGKAPSTQQFSPDLQTIRLSSKNGDSVFSDSMLVPDMGKKALLRSAADAVTAYKRTYDAQGRVETELFNNAALGQVKGESGADGRCYRYGEDGLLRAWYYIDAKGNVMNNKQGIAGQEYTRDAAGNVDSVTYVNADGEHVYRQDGVSVMKLTWSKQGIICTEYYDAEEKPCLNTDGFHRQRMEFDANGMVRRRSLEDVQGRPVAWDGAACSVGYEYDARGREKKSTYYDAAGKPCLNRRGYCSVVADYEDRLGGYLYRERFLDTQGNAMKPKRTPYASQVHVYDADGYMVEQAYFDLSGKPCRVNGAARVTIERKNGFAVCRTTYDENGAPCISDNGVCSIRAERDAAGNITKLAHYDVQGNPCLNANGIFCITYRYNDTHKVEEIRRYGTDAKTLCSPTNGMPSMEKFEYKDDCGHLTKMASFGPDGLPQANEEGVSCYEIVYSPTGEIEMIKESEPNGEGGHRPITVRPPVVTYEYDDKGCVKEERFCQEDGRTPAMSPKGFHRSKMTYAPCGKEASVAYYDVAGKLAVNVLGYAKAEYEYDARGRKIRTVYYTQEAKRGCLAGPVSEFRYEYNDLGEVTKTRYYNAAGKLLLEK